MIVRFVILNSKILICELKTYFLSDILALFFALLTKYHKIMYKDYLKIQMFYIFF